MRSAATCRQCGSTELANRGPIARGRFFAGHALAPTWAGGSLLECKRCALVFRFPIESDEVYELLYATAEGGVYASHELRHDQELARAKILERHRSGSVLDVGCFDGALLDSLGPSFAKFGVEPSRAAVEVCSKRGIEILAPSVRSLRDITRQFDVVCAIDVIEHLPNPLAFLADLKPLVRPGGSILISTGNASAPAWRLFGGRYWYCSFPEHISFVSPEWVSTAAAELGLTVAALDAFRHRHSGTSDAQARLGFAKRLAASSAEYVLAPFVPAYRRLGPRFVLGFPGVVDDHLLAVFVAGDDRGRTGDLEREDRVT